MPTTKQNPFGGEVEEEGHGEAGSVNHKSYGDLTMISPTILSETYFFLFNTLSSYLSGKSSERHAEGARPPRRQKYISVMFGLLSQSRS